MTSKAIQLRLEGERHIADMTAAFLTRNLRKKPTQEEVCKNAGCNECKLKRIFREYYKMGMFHYLMRMRMEKAKQLMEETDYSMAQIASMIGYTETSFSNAFKRLYGETPREWRWRA